MAYFVWLKHNNEISRFARYEIILTDYEIFFFLVIIPVVTTSYNIAMADKTRVLEDCALMIESVCGCTELDA